MNDPDYIVDVEGLEASPPQAEVPAGGRRWLGVLFRCCAVYGRIYRNPAGTRYEGACPRCGRPLNIRVGAGGTTARFFAAD